MGGKKVRVKENMRTRMENVGKNRKESKKSDTLCEGLIIGLERNLALEMSPGNHKDDTS